MILNVPPRMKTSQSELFYQSLLFGAFYNIEKNFAEFEAPSSYGYVDAIVNTKDKIYLFELRIN